MPELEPKATYWLILTNFQSHWCEYTQHTQLQTHLHAVRQTADLFVLTDAQEVTIRVGCATVFVFACMRVCAMLDHDISDMVIITFMSYLCVSNEYKYFLTWTTFCYQRILYCSCIVADCIILSLCVSVCLFFYFLIYVSHDLYVWWLVLTDVWVLYSSLSPNVFAGKHTDHINTHSLGTV